MTTPTLISTLGTIFAVIILGAIAYIVISLVAGIIKFFLTGALVIIIAIIIYRYVQSFFKN